MTPAGKLIFVDLETTGANPQLDRITEIGIVEVDGDSVTHWSSLVNPGMAIPPFIQNLTGISNEMVADAPVFDSLIGELLPRLSGGLFIAHNARFDYGFLRSAFKAAGQPWRCESLCTVKLSRQLYPKEAKHNLDTLIARHHLIAEARHRALADADLLWQLWGKLENETAPEVFSAAVTRLLARPSLPGLLDADSVDEIPNTPGVYLFYGEYDALLYVGKSVHLRQRVLAHFSADMRDPKEMQMAQQIRRLEWIATAGELGALLQEAQLIKQRQPLHNRRLRRQDELCSWQLDTGQPILRLASEIDFGQAAHLHGLYSSHRKAEDALRTLAETHQLCLVTLGLETRTEATQPCFAYQCRRCQGACIGLESAARHQARLADALAALHVTSWPWPGAIGLLENGANGAGDIHVIHNWSWLGTVQTEDAARALLAQVPQRPRFDHDTYKILLRHVTRSDAPILHFEK